jgi:putative flavoprotein involved in K+ transport
LRDGTTLIVGAGNSGLQIGTEIADLKPVHVSVGKRPKIIPKKILDKSLFWWFEKLKISEVTGDSKIGKIIKKNDPIIGTESKEYIKRGSMVLHSRVKDAQEKNVFFDDGSELAVDNVIWSTGYKFDYSWIKLNGILDEAGEPLHHRGISPQPGLYFVGLPWQHKRGSALLLGVAEDAKYLTEEIQKQLTMLGKEKLANV